MRVISGNLPCYLRLFSSFYELCSCSYGIVQGRYNYFFFQNIFIWLLFHTLEIFKFCKNKFKILLCIATVVANWNTTPVTSRLFPIPYWFTQMFCLNFILFQHCLFLNCEICKNRLEYCHRKKKIIYKNNKKSAQVRTVDIFSGSGV